MHDVYIQLYIILVFKFSSFYYFYSVHVEFKTSITPSDNCACSDPECSDPLATSPTSRTQLQVAVRHEGPGLAPETTIGTNTQQVYM